MTDKLKKFLIVIWTDGGHVDREVEEYARDAEEAIKRVAEKYGKPKTHVWSRGEI